jgi:hypothetical protein
VGVRVIVTAFVVVAATAACRGSETHYSRDDVVRAFRAEGIQLVTLTSRLATPNTRTVFPKKKQGEEMLAPNSGGPDFVAPNSGGPFFVLLFNTQRRATFAFKTLASQATSDSFDLQWHNVVVMSDEGVTPEVRRRVRHALARLAD